MKTEIRSLSAIDMPLVQELAYKIWPIAYREILSKAQLDYMLNWMYSLNSLTQQLQEGHKYYGIYEAEEFLGFLDLQLNYPFENELKINKIYVLSSSQGKGLGLKLMRFALETARISAMQSVSLQVNRHNKAKDFYAKIGFTVREEKKFDIGNGYFMDDFVMEYRF